LTATNKEESLDDENDKDGISENVNTENHEKEKEQHMNSTSGTESESEQQDSIKENDVKVTNSEEIESSCEINN